MGLMSRNEVETTFRLAREIHEEGKPLPTEIADINQRIREATRRAQLFTEKLHAIDYGMVNEIVRLMHERDGLVEGWVQSESPA